MFIYLSKKIAIPNGIQLRSLAWNPEHGWIACGGDEGLLKVLKLDAPRGEAQGKGAAAPPAASGGSSNLSMNQTLEGHNGGVVCATWNAPFRKLTTSDESGLIIVWMLYKGSWYEEMINNRNKSVVTAMRWTGDGQKICIVYEDGAVIVGSVDGNRLWGKDLSCGLRNVEWSPDAATILFVTSDNEIQLYDANGGKGKLLQLADARVADSDGKKKRGAPPTIVDVQWYDGMEGYEDASAPTLAIGYTNGVIHLTRGADDGREPIAVRTKLNLTQCRWTTKGTALAAAGTYATNGPDGSERDVACVHFFSPYGTKLRTMRVPGGGIRGVSWEGGGLRVALAVDSYVYFANIRPDFNWGYFADTLVAAYSPPERSGLTVLFWNLKTNQRAKRRANGLRKLAASGEHCVLVSSFSSSLNGQQQQQQHQGQPGEEKKTYEVALHNAAGATVETRTIEIEPRFAAMTPHHAIVASERFVYMWQYAKPSSNIPGAVSSAKHEELASELISLRDATAKERVLDCDRQQGGAVRLIEDFELPEDADECADPIVALCASEKVLIVAKASGIVQQYTLPHLAVDKRYQASVIPWKMALNSTGAKLAVVDANGLLNVIDLEAKPGTTKKSKKKVDKDAYGATLAFERKDTWDVRWADDDPDMLATMEKTRLYVYGPDCKQIGDPVVAPGFLAGFNEMRVTSLIVEDVVNNPDAPSSSDVILTTELQSLKILRQVLGTTSDDAGTTTNGTGTTSSSNLADAFQKAASLGGQKALYRLVAEAALEALELTHAERALVKCQDYAGLQLVKKLHGVSDRMKQRALVAAFLGKYDDADQIYRDLDRADLSVELRSRLGDWGRVAQLVKSGAGDDVRLEGAYKNLGREFAGAGRWDRAREFFELAKESDALAECYYRLNDFAALEALLKDTPDGAPLLASLGERFESVGLHEPAVDAYLRAGERKKAIDCCILLHQWGKAVEIAAECGFQQIEGLLVKYSSELLAQNKDLLAVELYRKANKPTDAAKLLARIAEKVGMQQVNPLRAKKLLVLAALEVERYRKTTLDAAMTQTRNGRSLAQTTAMTLNTLMTHDRESVSESGAAARVLDSAWRGAAAYHYYLLAHRQLYDGHPDAAKKTAIRLAEFEDVLDKRDLYSLVALAAYHAKDFHVCSRAFIKLETLDTLDPDQFEQIQALALQIFTEHPPTDAHNLDPCYAACLETGTPYHACTVTGQACLDQRTLVCPVCRHHALELELKGATFCPLCHSNYPAHVLGL